MATFVTPKTWAVNERLDSADLNALTAEIAASVNDIVNAQISATANIDGSKIASAPNGIRNPGINANAITTAKLAVGATVEGSSSGVSTVAQTILGSAGEVDVESSGGTPLDVVLSVSSRGGDVLGFFIVSGYIEPDTADRVVTFKFQVDDTTRGADNDLITGGVIIEASPFNGDAGQHPFSVMIPILDTNTNASESTTYHMRAEVSGGANDTLVINDAQIEVLELA